VIQFDAPFVLWMSPAAALLVGLLAFWARGARVRHARRWSRSLAVKAARTGRFGWLLLAGSALAACVALSGPRWGSRVVTAETKGLNVLLAVDISRSMLAVDVPPSRLERAKEQVRRLVHQLEGDRVGLVAFAGQSFILSPLTVDGSALLMLADALDPDLTSASGTDLSRVLLQGRDLLFAGDPVADRVLVVFTDGEGHDSLAGIDAAAERLRRDGVRLVLVAEGDIEPVTIPILDPEGNAIGLQRDPAGEVVRTVRRDDLIQAIADRAHGVVVPAELGDQAGAVRDLIEGYARTPQASSTAEQDISRAWIAALAAVVLLLLHTLTRRTMALAGLVLSLGLSGTARAQGPVNRGDRAWELGDFRAAAESYLVQVRRQEGGETAWYNLGTAALAIGDTATARRALEQTVGSLDPDMRFRSLYNLGLLRLRQAAADSGHAAAYLEEAFQRYREALLLRPGDRDAQWNLELAVRNRPPSSSGGSSGPGGGGGAASDAEQPSGLSPSQAEQILNSMAEEERQTLLDRNTRRRRGRETRGWKEW
jgi:Ca-activated chloride channel family protein